MGTYHRAQWVSTGAGTSRRQRASGVYHWFMPTSLRDLAVSLDQDVVSDIARAERALAMLETQTPVNTEGIARLLLRSESISSSRIEGLVIGSNRLLRAELQLVEPDNIRYDSKAAAVLGNVHAMERAIEEAFSEHELTTSTICAIHRELCKGTDLEPWGGVIRTMQNWVGGGGSNPLNAEYVPPAPEALPELLDDLAAYAAREDISPVVQAAMLHAQFETIHPFVDGNGRVGRALIQVCLMRRGVERSAVPPISLTFATEKADYYAVLSKYQHATSEAEEHSAINDWLSFFAGAVVQACDDVVEIRTDLQTMLDEWKGRLGTVRMGSAVWLMLDKMQGMPYFSVETMMRATGRSRQAVNVAVQRLLEAGIIRQTSQGKRSRIFEVPEVLEEFNMVERRLASPQRDTGIEPPVRPVPERVRQTT